jgi:hypothetical protein
VRSRHVVARGFALCVHARFSHKICCAAMCCGALRRCPRSGGVVLRCF